MSNKSSENLIKVGLIIAVSLFIIVLLIKRFVYFRPSSHFVPTQEAYTPIRHGHLHGWLLEHPEAKKIILLCHGNGGNISHREGKMREMRNMGYSVLCFDYSGYGKSAGVPSEQQLYDDASTMVALLRQTYSPDQIILYGESLGAPVATYAARRYSISTLILESPLPGIKILIQNKFPSLAWLSFLFSEFNTAEYLHGFKGRSMILHSPTDEIIPYRSIQGLQQLCSVSVDMDGSHNDPIIPWEEIRKFINVT